MSAGAEGEARVDLNANAAGGRGVLPPFRADENALADFHGLEMLVGEGNPVARVGGHGLSTEAGDEFGLTRIVIEEGAEARRVPGCLKSAVFQFHDARGAGFEEVGDEKVFFRLPAGEVD